MADCCAGRQSGWQTGGAADRWGSRQTYGLEVRRVVKQVGWQTGRLADMQTDRRAGWQTSGLADWWADRSWSTRKLADIRTG